MLRWLKLTGVGPAPEMEMHFAPRLNVLTGDNGLGKSLFLETIWYALTGSWAGLVALPRPDAEVARIELATHETPSAEINFWKQSPKWDMDEDFRPTSDLVIYARVDGSVAIWDPSRRSSEWDTHGTVFQFSPKEIVEGQDRDEKKVCRGLIEDWVTWQERRPETSSGRAFARLCGILDTLSPNPDAHETIRPADPIRLLTMNAHSVLTMDARTFPTIDTGYGAIPIIHASAAMQRIINLAYLITWAWHEHLHACELFKKQRANSIVFLIDEVENHLHPEWQRRILPALLKVLESLGDGIEVQMHVTTHAPMVLASLEPHWKDDLDELFLFALEDGKVVLRSEEIIARGDATRWLTSHVFGLEWARSVEAQRVLEDARAVMRGEQPQYFKTPEEIDAELERVLPDQDPFWARWTTYMEKSRP